MCVWGGGGGEEGDTDAPWTAKLHPLLCITFTPANLPEFQLTTSCIPALRVHSSLPSQSKIYFIIYTCIDIRISQYMEYTLRL